MVLFLHVLYCTGGTTCIDARKGVISCSLCHVDVLLLLDDHHFGGLMYETLAFSQLLCVHSDSVVMVVVRPLGDFGRRVWCRVLYLRVRFDMTSMVMSFDMLFNSSLVRGYLIYYDVS